MVMATATGHIFDQKLARKNSLLFYLLTATAVVVLYCTYFYWQSLADTERWAELERSYIHSVSVDAQHQFTDVFGDILLLSQSEHLYRNENGSKQQLQQEFRRIMEVRRFYDQLRWIDAQGAELVRVNMLPEGEAIAVAAEKLQQKKQRYYVTETLKLQAGDLFVSRIDLNEEFGTIDLPYKAVIRIATPLFSTNGERNGMIVANIYAAKLLDKLAEWQQQSDSELMLLNQEGYWLYSGNPEQNWGFQLPHKRSFATSYPELWQQLQQQSSGQLQSAAHIVTFAKVAGVSLQDNQLNSNYSPLHNSNIVQQENAWYLVSLQQQRSWYS